MLSSMEIGARYEISELTNTCDIDLDEHTGYTWGATRPNPDDLHTEVQYHCQCGQRGYWVPEHAARSNGYTG